VGRRPRGPAKRRGLVGALVTAIALAGVHGAGSGLGRPAARSVVGQPRVRSTHDRVRRRASRRGPARHDGGAGARRRPRAGLLRRVACRPRGRRGAARRRAAHDVRAGVGHGPGRSVDRVGCPAGEAGNRPREMPWHLPALGVAPRPDLPRPAVAAGDHACAPASLGNDGRRRRIARRWRSGTGAARGDAAQRNHRPGAGSAGCPRSAGRRTETHAALSRSAVGAGCACRPRGRAGPVGPARTTPSASCATTTTAQAAGTGRPGPAPTHPGTSTGPGAGRSGARASPAEGRLSTAEAPRTLPRPSPGGDRAHVG